MPFRTPALAIQLTAIAALGLLASAATAQQAGSTEEAEVFVRVVDADPPSGTLEISLFASAEEFMRQPFLQTSGPVREDGTYLARFGKVPHGDYAVVVVHDANDNGRLDTGFLGFGGESYAYSNDASPLFGRPEFDEVRFAVSGETRIEITLQ